jgi:hypothetical protein
MDTEKVETLTRQELFDLVWQETLSKVSKRLGIGINRIVKLCEQYAIPRPSSGHWALVSWGEAPEKPGLPIWEHEELIPLSSTKRQSVERKPSAIEMPEEPVVSKEVIQSYTDRVSSTDEQKPEVNPTSNKNPAVIVSAKEHVSLPIHPIVAKLKLQTHAAKQGKNRNQDSLDAMGTSHVSVSKNQLERACRILDAIYKSWEAKGFQTRLSDGALLRNDEVVTFALHEIYRRVDRRPQGQSWQAWEYEETGLLELVLTHGTVEKIRRRWCDGRIQRLETMLGSFLETVLLSMDALRLERLDRECEMRQEVLAVQNSKRRELEEHRRREQIKQLNQMVDGWLRAKQIRDYMQAVNDRVDSGMARPQDRLAFEKWRVWVQWYADDLDPLTFAGADPERKLSPTNTPLAELDLTSKTKAGLAGVSVADTDGLFKLSKRSIAMHDPERSWLLIRELARVMTGLGYDMEKTDWLL